MTLSYITKLMLVKISCCGSPDLQRGENRELKMISNKLASQSSTGSDLQSFDQPRESNETVTLSLSKGDYMEKKFAKID
jgi:hypothetical protein